MADLDVDGALGVSPRNGHRGTLVDANTNRPLFAPPLTEEELGTLGSGSDYTVFLDHLGVACLDFGFSPGGAYGVYHSVAHVPLIIRYPGGVPAGRAARNRSAMIS